MKQLMIMLSLCLPLALFSQEQMAKESAMEKEAPSVQEASVGFISYAEMRALALADKFSEEQYDWRPAEGVRSVREVLLHLAAANYFFMLASGFELPEGVNPMEMETNITGKKNVMNAVKDSYAYIKEKVMEIEDNALGDEVKFPFPGEHNKLTAILLGVDHNGEHVGQLIAYARMNGITPPWSEGGGGE